VTKKAKVLVVDDEADSLEIMRMILENEGYEVQTASDGQEALSKISQQKLDLIFLDVKMPKLDGYELCRKLKRDPETTKIPVVMHSASGSEKTRAYAHEAGADGFMFKPFTMKKLVGIVKKHLGDR
jgi:CheY-like chemotaxis protein